MGGGDKDRGYQQEGFKIVRNMTNAKTRNL